MTPATDELFADRYRLERRLGVGGMSTVQLAFDTRLERYVAVKLLAEHLAEDASFVSRFRREALAAARLVHPNVVQVFDFGLDEATGRQFIVMERVDGQSCAEILRDRGALPVEEAVSILTQSCRGLDYAHRNGVVHRDVKPGNLLRNREGVVKLADFGIAKAAAQSDITKVGSVLGTAAYLSPEQARGEPAGPPADLYALGVVSYQLLTNRLPYEAASLTDLARLQESGLPLSPHDVDPDVPVELSEAVVRALHPLPEGRYEDAPAMEQALRDGLRGIAPPAPTAPTSALADDTSATRMLGDATAATTAQPAEPRRRRRLEPMPEPPRRREPARAAAARPPARRRRRSPFKAILATVLLLGIVVVGVLAYQLVQESSTRAVQLKRDISGNVQDAVDELKGLIEDNTR
jgi:eukaryotic-like serine/threonine-protein kinase